MISLLGMLILSYNRSSSLVESLEKIDTLRIKILTTPIPTKIELRLRWEGMLNRLYYSLALHANPLKKDEMTRMITSTKHTKVSSAQQEVISYKRAMDYLSQEWYVSKKTVSIKTVLTLYEILNHPSLAKSITNLIRLSEEPLKRVLDYIQSGREHPIIQAGIAQIQLTTLAPFDQDSQLVARLLASLLLYKNGYDCRGLWDLEEYLYKNKTTMEKLTQSTMKFTSLTPWLEFYAQAAVVQLSKIDRDISSERYSTTLPSAFFSLNERQKEVLSLLDQPDEKITNRKVQKRFGISQITASRDLTKMVTLGLLFPHGKGRSVYYTKV